MLNKRALSLVTGLAALPCFLQAAATIVIQNGDAAGVGFNDATVVAPVGGNSGTTVGQQRLIAFSAAADKWGATLASAATITVRATWTALSCTANSAVLGSAGPQSLWRDFPGAPFAATWYHAALANKLYGSDIDPANPEIIANFNVNLGQPGCLTGIFFYLGLDNAHGSNVDLVTVLEHEFAHGLGFSSTTNGNTGALQSGYPGAWDLFLLDNATNKLWKDMSPTERVASALNTGHLVWTGSNVTSGVPQVLSAGTPQLNLSAPASVAGPYQVGTAAFGAPLNSTGVTAEVMPVVDTAPNTGLACSALSALNASAVNGKIAVVDRGTCSYKTKAKRVQDAGAVGMILINNAPGGPAPAMGDDLSVTGVTIPSVSVTQADGGTLKAALATRSRAHSGMFAKLGVNLAVYLGADSSGRALMYAPNPYQSGSSVSHYNVSAFPNQLMEPSINGDLTHEVTIPTDLTFQLLRDLGWD